MVDLCWNGIHKHFQIALLRRGLDSEGDNLLDLLRYAIMEEEADERANEVANSSYNKPRMVGGKASGLSRKRGGFKSRSGPQPFNANAQVSSVARHVNQLFGSIP